MSKQKNYKVEEKTDKVVERFIPKNGEEWLKEYFDKIIAFVTPHVKNKVILDAGCGSGYEDSVWLKKGAKHIDAYDISDEALEFARNHYKGAVTFNKKDFNVSGFKKNFYDIAVSIEVIEHLKNYAFYLTNIYDSLKKGGLFFVSTPNAALSEGVNEFHLKEFTYNEMVAALTEAGFIILKTAGLSENSASGIAGNLLPASFIAVLKQIPIYPFLVKLFLKPKPRDAAGAETMIFKCRKG